MNFLVDNFFEDLHKIKGSRRVDVFRQTKQRCFIFPTEHYLVIVCFTVGQPFAFVVTVSKEGFLTLCTHKMLQTHMVSNNRQWAHYFGSDLIRSTTTRSVQSRRPVTATKRKTGRDGQQESELLREH